LGVARIMYAKGMRRNQYLQLRKLEEWWSRSG
jgi:hypothetical protein